MSTEPAAPPAIHVHELQKSYGRVEVLRGVCLTAHAGQVTGLLGANGAGKSTTLKILLGLCRSDAGSALLEGTPYVDLSHPTAVVGAVLDPITVDPAMSGRDHLRTYAALGGHPRGRVDGCIEQLGMAGYAHRAAGTWSTGQRQRLSIATALLGEPRVVILDEPTNGLDPDGIAWVRQLMRGLADAGRTVLVSSHVLAEVEPVLDAVTVLRDGATVAGGQLEALKQQHRARTLEELYFRLAQRPAA